MSLRRLVQGYGNEDAIINKSVPSESVIDILDASQVATCIGLQ